MTTATKINEKKVNVVKPFVGSFSKKASLTRPVLKTALITESHIIATDSHRLIRIKHHEENVLPYLHHFKHEISGHCEVSNYPDVSRLIPNPSDAQHSFTLDFKDFLEGHDILKIAAKEHVSHLIKLKNNRLEVAAVTEELNKKGKKVKKPLYDQISASYTLDQNTNIEEVAYNCSFMLDILKTFKKLKSTDIQVYFYGKHRPIMFISGDVEILLLPVRAQ